MPCLNPCSSIRWPTPPGQPAAARPRLARRPAGTDAGGPRGHFVGAKNNRNPRAAAVGALELGFEAGPRCTITDRPASRRSSPTCAAGRWASSPWCTTYTSHSGSAWTSTLCSHRSSRRSMPMAKPQPAPACRPAARSGRRSGAAAHRALRAQAIGHPLEHGRVVVQHRGFRRYSMPASASAGTRRRSARAIPRRKSNRRGALSAISCMAGFLVSSTRSGLVYMRRWPSSSRMSRCFSRCSINAARCARAPAGPANSIRAARRSGPAASTGGPA